MKRLFTIIALICFLSTASAQETPIFELEHYSLEEITVFLNQQFSYTSDPSFGEPYWCNAPIDLACQIFPFLRVYNDLIHMPPKPSDIEKLVSFQSLADLEKIKKHITPYILESITIDFLNYNQHYLENLYMEKQFESSGFKTLDDYIANQIHEQFKARVYELLINYSDGFLLPHTYFSNGWSSLKNNFTQLDYDSYPRELYSHYYPDEISLPEEAEILLGGSVALVKTVHSLFLQKSESNFTDTSNIPDEYVWVNGTNAVGLYSRKRYTVVDEFGQAFNILENPVETRITTRTIGGIDLLEILVMFDLLPLEE